MCRGIAVAVALLLAAPAFGSNAKVAALQVGLRAHSVYAGPVDGVAGQGTAAAVRAFQTRAGLAVDGVAGPETRAALARSGTWNWAFAELQFELAWHGFPSGALDGRFGPRTEAAIKRFQRHTGLPDDGVAGASTRAALARPRPASPLSFSWPLALPVTGLFGPRGDRFHTGIDFAAASGTPVLAARSGRVTFAGWHPGGWGNLVTVAHGSGVRTMSAHLSRVVVQVGQRVAAGQQLGLVGATGRADGPHLHFEVRLRGAAVDPLRALPG